MQTATYEARRESLTTYFDRTAADAWEALTSDAPVGRIRATVRAGRDRMRDLLLSRLPADLVGTRLLDAGCGTGALSIEAARRGADVTGVDVSGRMVAIARRRATSELGPERIAFSSGDMLDPALGRFDHVVLMDSLIHYDRRDIVGALAGLAERTERSILFTIAPGTPLLTAMHSVGQLFPRGNRSPALSPIAPARLEQTIASDGVLSGWTLSFSERIKSGFYTSQAMELTRQ
ncbi:magnesium protoporphyrin IX methyltransferase [Aurantiacibacter spongiae]|uniref:Magnesium protoporphyrin IX methyltransferase n=1 Tax=Aurantiacibacter spongiae TaxID=2488860 RepID=A0A3N5CYL0_9SPHN|nr:magnesium protoporphyrin IX methyltransferase [Aurantiacibacter spongiae]RPF71769.1 magnesium protoporphyrin IX methyltransferase [Aurantiacibacter spongiae]